MRQVGPRQQRRLCCHLRGDAWRDLLCGSARRDWGHGCGQPKVSPRPPGELRDEAHRAYRVRQDFSVRSSHRTLYRLSKYSRMPASLTASLQRPNESVRSGWGFGTDARTRRSMARSPRYRGNGNQQRHERFPLRLPFAGVKEAYRGQQARSVSTHFIS